MNETQTNLDHLPKDINTVLKREETKYPMSIVNKVGKIHQTEHFSGGFVELDETIK